MSIKHMCASQVDTITSEESAYTAACRMRDHLVGSLVVCDEQERPIGILTDRDLATRVVATSRNAIETPIADIMTREPRCIEADSTLEQALSAMQRVPCRRLPVIDVEGKLEALVTLDDVLSQISRRFGQIGNVVGQESPASLDAV
jgi:CBS domain-containing protein